jgi:hypothetical protein
LIFCDPPGDAAARGHPHHIAAIGHQVESFQELDVDPGDKGDGQDRALGGAANAVTVETRVSEAVLEHVIADHVIER